MHPLALALFEKTYAQGVRLPSRPGAASWAAAEQGEVNAAALWLHPKEE